MTRTLTEIADTLYFTNGAKLTRKDINIVVNSCFQHIAKALIDEDNVMITNFGKFKRTKHNSVSFAPSPNLKKEIRKELN